LVSKRRAAVGLAELERLHENEPDASWPGFWYHQRLLARQLRPICQITYRRIALVALTQYGPVRLTLDRSIQAVALNSVGFNDESRGVPLSDDQVIVEFKFRVDMPVLFKDLVAQFAILPKRISKYRLAIVALGLVEPEQPVQIQEGPQKPVCLSS